ncbi:MAG: hypothetical protein ACLFQB_09885 [Chitinispirillaceae bacterium]
MFESFRSREGGAIVAVLLVAVLLNITLAIIYFTVNSSIKKSGDRRAETATLNAAEAAKEKLYAMIRKGEFVPVPETRITAFSNVSFGNGTYSVSCSTDATGDTLHILATGQEKGASKKLEIIGVLEPPIDFPVPSVTGAVTARNHIEVNGNIVVDGRDYDSIWSGSILNSGVFGVSTCSTLTLKGASAVGGNGLAPESKKDFKDIRHTVTEENVDVTDKYNSPESFLGVSSGSLDPYKVSDLPPAPFHGIYYVQKDVGPLHFDTFSSGILIVNNSTKTAELRANTGMFKGIIIVDKTAKLNGNAKILGAVVTLTDGVVEYVKDPTSYFTGTADIRYSSRVLKNLEKYCSNLLKDVREISWRELE